MLLLRAQPHPQCIQHKSKEHLHSQDVRTTCSKNDFLMKSDDRYVIYSAASKPLLTIFQLQ